MRRWTRRAAIGLAILFVVIQFYRPGRGNPPVDPDRTVTAQLDVPTAVNDIFQRSCSDCHSFDTRWPWYSNVAPVSWWLVEHVAHARNELNLSDWARYDARTADHKLEELCEKVEEGEMPLPSYLLIHRSSALDAADIETLCNWANEQRHQLQEQMVQ